MTNPTPPSVAIPHEETQFEVWQDDMLVASSTDEADARHYLAVYGEDGPARIVKAVTTRTDLLATPSPAAQDEPSRHITREELVRALYDGWPLTVFSKALQEQTGLPMDAVVDFETAKKTGARFDGLERHADIVLDFLRSCLRRR